MLTLIGIALIITAGIFVYDAYGMGGSGPNISTSTVTKTVTATSVQTVPGQTSTTTTTKTLTSTYTSVTTYIIQSQVQTYTTTVGSTSTVYAVTTIQQPVYSTTTVTSTVNGTPTTTTATITSTVTFQFTTTGSTTTISSLPPLNELDVYVYANTGTGNGFTFTLTPLGGSSVDVIFSCSNGTFEQTQPANGSGFVAFTWQASNYGTCYSALITATSPYYGYQPATVTQPIPSTSGAVATVVEANGVLSVVRLGIIGSAIGLQSPFYELGIALPFALFGGFLVYKDREEE